MSETYNGNYAPEMFDENKRYYLLQAQQQTNLTDAELRDLHGISNTFIRRFIQEEIGNTAAIDSGFKITQSFDSSNNFRIVGGDGTHAGVFYFNGYRLFLNNSIDYTSQNNTGLLTRDGFTETVLPAFTTPTGSLANFAGIALNGSNIVTVGDGTIIDTSNWGRDWVEVYPPSANPDQFQAVSFGDASTVYAVGTGPSIIQSLDAGQTWTSLPPGILSDDLADVVFVNNSVGWVVGQGGVIAKTTTAGTSWTPQGSVTTDLSGVTAFNANNLWAVGVDGTIVYGNGTTWVSQNSFSTADLNDVYAVTANRIFAVGNDGTILRSLDGTNWISFASGTPENLYGVFFPNDTTGWAVGANGVVVKTSNIGNSWTATTLVPGIDFKSVVFSDTTGFIVGSNGAIYRTLNDGSTWNPYRLDYVYVDFHLAESSADGSSEYYDASLFDSLVGPPDANRLRMVADVNISQGWPAPSAYSLDGTVQHLTTVLATIQRSVGKNVILEADITDERLVVRSVNEIDQFLKSGGIDSSSIADSAITPAKLDITADYTIGSLLVSRDTSVGGDVEITGSLSIDGTGDNVFNGDLYVNGLTFLGDSSSPYEDKVTIYGTISQVYDGTATSPVYDVQVISPTDSTQVINIRSVGSGQIFHVEMDNTSTTKPMFDATNLGAGYDFSLRHINPIGGIFDITDDASGNSFNIRKQALAGSVLNIQTNSTDPAIKIASNVGSIHIDQSGNGVAIKINSIDATALQVSSSNSGADVDIYHGDSVGQAIKIDSSGEQAILIQNKRGQGFVATQQANDTLMVLQKDSTGLGRVLDVYNYGSAEGLAVGNLGSGIAAIISHVGDGTSPGLDVFVAGTERGPAFRVNKSNDEVGEVVRLWNQGYGESISISHDRTDSTANVITIDNKATSTKDTSSNNWWIDNTGNMFTRGDVSTARVAFDSTHFMSADLIRLDPSIDSSNPAIAGQLFQDSGFIRISDGTNPLPVPFFGTTGMIGATGLEGPTGIQGITGIQGLGETGVRGETGIQGMTGVQGLGETGVRGETGIQGMTGVQGLGETGLQGSTGVQAQGETGVQGITGVQGTTGAKGPTGIQGATGTGTTGATGIQAPMALSMSMYDAGAVVLVANGVKGLGISSKLDGRTLVNLLAAVGVPGTGAPQTSLFGEGGRALRFI